MCVEGESLFLFGFTSKGSPTRQDRYEIGCLSLTDMKPLWHTKVYNVDEKCQILVHKDNIAIIKPDQELTSIRIPDLNSGESKVRRCKECGFYYATPSDKSDHEGSGRHVTIFTDYDTSTIEDF